MNAPTPNLHAEQPFAEAFAALTEREQLRLFKQLADKLHSGSRGYDLIQDGIRELAHDLADWSGFQGDDLAERYLAPAWGSMDLAPVVRLSGNSVIA